MVRHWFIFFAAIQEKSRFAWQLSLCCNFYCIMVKYKKRGDGNEKIYIIYFINFVDSWRIAFVFAARKHLYYKIFGFYKRCK